MCESSEICKTMGARVKEARAASGLSVRKLAAASGIGASTIIEIEGGRANPTLRTLGVLAETLGCSIRLVKK